MIIPYREAESRADPVKRRFNNDLCKARVTIEQVIGILKSRFPILKRGLKFKSMETCGKVIICCAALHNYILENGDSNDDPDDMSENNDFRPAESDSENEEENDVPNQRQRRGQKTSDKILAQFYN